MKNTFYFILKALPFSRYLNFDLKFLVMSKKGSIRKIKVNFKVYDATTDVNSYIDQYLKK